MRSPLPIDDVLERITLVLAKSPSLVLEAPPGAGKTTRVPPALLDVVEGEIVVLEPRRLAARLAAKRVAQELGDKLGERVGYRIRFDEVGGKETRIWFVTEGVLTRRLVRDPNLEGVGAVLLDEFHERHLHGDVALALLRRLQKTRRPDLRLVVMSATLEAERVKAFLGCESIRSMGRAFDVAIEHEDPSDRPLEVRVAGAVRRALREDSGGHVLVFLPGMREIALAEEAVRPIADAAGAITCILHGDRPPEEQDRAVAPSARRKVILSTNVAESSITIEGVGVVVDSGLVNSANVAPWSGLPTLRVVKASRASCTQRAGRAGRTREGRAFRLYTRADFESRPAHDVPEIQRLDLAQTVLELRAAGIRDVDWLDPPSAASITAAEDLLRRLGALDGDDVTDLGRRMLAHPLHPRLGRMIEEAKARGACLRRMWTAVLLLGERDVIVRREHAPTEACDIERRVDAIDEVAAARNTHQAARAAGLDPGATWAILRARSRFVRKDGGDESSELFRRCILAGMIDRVARRLRPNDAALALAGGGSAELAKESVVRDAMLMACAVAEERNGRVLVRMASAIEPEWILDYAADRVKDAATHEMDGERVMVTTRLTYDGLVLFESRSQAKPGPETARVLYEAARAKGAAYFAEELDALASRVRFAAEIAKDVPFSETILDDALREACETSASFEDLRNSALADLVRARLGAAASRIDRLAPARITLARGRSVKVVYEPGKPPHVASRMQDFFGMKETPRVGEGRVPLVLHLLAPNQRAVQVTQDLAGFWTRHYPAIRKELMRRYPKHPWPEDPLA